MKKIFLIFGGLLFLFSCSNDFVEEVESVAVKTKSLAMNEQNATFVLLNKEKIEEKGTSRMVTTQLSAYESSVSIYRYLYCSSGIIDHLYAVENSSKFSHDNRTYTQESQFFNLMPDDWSYDFEKKDVIAPLYRHRSLNTQNHKLSLTSWENGFSSEGILGYVFEKHEVGAVPLEEYYSSKRNSYLYTWSRAEIENWLPYHDTDFVYNKTIGYVYPGSVKDELKRPVKFILKNTGYNKTPVTLVLTVKVKENDSFWKLTYSAEVDDSNPSVSFPVNNTYTVVSADLAITNMNFNVTNTFVDITSPLFEEESLGVGGSSIVRLTKMISAYDVTYEFCYDVPVGTE